MQTTQGECNKGVTKASEIAQNTPEALLAEMLIKRGESVATAESCTGGNIAHRLTTIEGASQYFNGGVVAYANKVKINILHVSAETLQKHGAVSHEVAEQMAEGARMACKTTYAIATTGIAGPTGGSIEKPVGTVWIAVSTPNKTLSRIFHFDGSRSQNIERSSNEAIKMLFDHLCSFEKQTDLLRHE